MKIGILTFNRAVNYGAVLQSFALKTFLCQSGINADILDYRCPCIEDCYKIGTLKSQRTIKDKIKYIVQHKNKTERMRLFNSFLCEHDLIDGNGYYRENISECANNFDKIIVGSDQVWNPDAHNFDKTYLLDFYKSGNSKYSYAASFGLDSIDDAFCSEYVRLLSDFDSISVREQQGKKIVEEQLGLNARTDVDPVFLLDNSVWKECFSKKVDFSNKKYIFVYYFSLTDTLKRFVEKLSADTGLPVYYFGKAVVKPFNAKCKSFAAGPAEFLSAIYNAEYVVTNSFHGTAFSIKFEKKFFVELLSKGKKVNSRIENLMDTYGLNDRYINKASLINSKNCDIQWTQVRKRLNENISNSREYLLEIINS